MNCRKALITSSLRLSRENGGVEKEAESRFRKFVPRLAIKFSRRIGSYRSTVRTFQKGHASGFFSIVESQSPAAFLYPMELRSGVFLLNLTECFGLLVWKTEL